MTLLIKNLPLSRLRIDLDKDWKPHQPACRAGWHMPDYANRKSITVYNAGGEQTDYIFQVTIHQSISVTGNKIDEVWLNGFCRDDFNDLRFCNDAGGPVEYYIVPPITQEYGCSKVAVVRIKFPTIAHGDNRFWLYHNYPSATPGSSPIPF